MRIIFVDQQVTKPYTVETPKKEPLGGSQSAICYYVEALSQLGHEVILVNHIKDSIKENNVQIHPIKWYHDQRNYETDVIILCSAIFPEFFDNLEKNFRYKLSICWQGHHGAEPLLSKASKYLYHVDLFAFVSDYQRQHFCRHFNLPHEKSILMRNGISPFFQDVNILNKEERCIFFSNPQRGLNALAKLWPDVVKAFPNVKLDVFSSEKTYGKTEDSKFTLEDYDMLKKIPNVTVHEPAGQEKLAQMCAKSAFLVYPTHFVETSCIVYLEASAAGALPLISDLGVFSSYDFECVHYDTKFQSNFVEKTIQALNKFHNKKSEFIAESKKRSDQIRKEHNYIELSNNLISVIKTAIDIKRFAILRLNDIESDIHPKIKVYMGESMPLFFESRYKASVFFLRHGNGQNTNGLEHAAAASYKLSWDIMNSFASASNLLETYVKLGDVDEALRWARIVFSRYAVNTDHITKIMKFYDKFSIFDRISILEFIHSVFTESTSGDLSFLLGDAAIKAVGLYGLIEKHNTGNALYRDLIEKLHNGNLVRNDNEHLLKTLCSNLIFTSNYTYKEPCFMDDCLKYEKYTKAPNYIIKPFVKEVTGKIRIGFISGDFSNHPVTFILNGFIEHIHKLFDVYLFNECPHRNHIASNYTLNHVKENVIIHNISTIDSIKMIEERNIDILIDMCGHTSSYTQKIMDIIRVKPAKIIANYFAFPATTALKAVDFKLGDSICLPDSSKHLFTEEFQNIDGGMHCYRPWGKYTIEKTPSMVVRLGIFNNPRKFSTQFKQAVVRILKALPTSTLHFVYMSYADRSYVELIKLYFEQRGIDPKRLKFSSTQIFEEYAKFYNEVDIALDTFPYNGGTISIESLFLATPYITLLGDDYVSRIGASILHQVGYPELIVNTIEEYVQKTIELANDSVRLKQYHKTLHDSVMKSSLGNGEMFSKQFEKAVHQMLEKKGIIRTSNHTSQSPNPWNFFKRRYVISLKESTDRRESVKREMEKVNMNFEFFDAVDGRNNYESLRNICLKKNIIGMKAYDTLSPGALGCLLSHRGIFEKEYSQMNAGDDYWVLIMEDDIEFAPGFEKEVANYIQHWPKKSNIVKLIYWNQNESDYIKEIGNPYFIELKGLTLSTIAYAIHSSEFKIYLDHVYNTPIDLVTDYPMHGFRTLNTLPKEYYRLFKGDKCFFNGIGREKNQEFKSIIGNHWSDNIIIGTSKTNTKTIVLDEVYPENSKFVLKPHTFSDTFDIRIDADKLIVRRTDMDSGWGYSHSGTIMEEKKKKNPWDFFKRRYVISLSKSNERRLSVSEELKKVNMDFEFVDAMDGRVDFEFLRRKCHKDGIIGDRGLKELSPGALGCLLSHRNVYKKAYEEAKGEDCWFLIMEDDIQFSSQLMNNLQSYIDHWPSKTSLVKLGYWNNYNPNYKKEVGNPYFVELTAQTTCTVCYAIRTDLLPHLIKKKYDTAIDTIVDYPMYGFKTIDGESKEFLRRERFDAYFEGVCSEKETLVSTIIDYREDKKQANPWNFFKRRYVISLPQSTDRREYVTQELKKVNMDFEFFDAVDGRKNYENLRTMSLRKGIIGQKAYDELSPGALGCLLSHRGIYEKEYLSMKPDDDYWILIMEDDVEFAPGLYEEMPKYIQHWPEMSKIIKLVYWPPYLGKYNIEINNPYFVEINHYTCGTMAYALHSSILKHLVDHIFVTPIDLFYFKPTHGFRTIKNAPHEFFRVGGSHYNDFFEGVGRENNKQLPSTIDEHENKVIHIGTSKTNIKYIPIGHTNPNTKYRILQHPYNDRFEIRTENNMLIVRRVDADCGWGFPHRAVVVDITSRFS